MQEIDQTMNSQKTLHSSPSRVSYGVPFVSILEKIIMFWRDSISSSLKSDILIPEATQLTWWRHQMETFSALLAICAGNSLSPVNSPHKGQWCGALMFSLIFVWINYWVNNHKAGDLRRYWAHYDATVMQGINLILFHHRCPTRSLRSEVPRNAPCVMPADKSQHNQYHMYQMLLLSSQ